MQERGGDRPRDAGGQGEPDSGRGQRLVVVVVRGAAVGAHGRLGVPAQRILQQPRQLRVSVRDMRRASVHQRRDNIPERGQREVDLGGLLQPVPRRARLALPLATRLIDQVQLVDPVTQQRR